MNQSLKERQTVRMFSNPLVGGLLSAVLFAALSPSATASTPSCPLYCYHFDATNAAYGLDFRNANAGTGPHVLRRKCPNPANPDMWVNAFGSGALGSGDAFWSKTSTSLWLQGDAAGLGCSAETGFTISFWIYGPEKPEAWSDFFGLRVGDDELRFEYTDRLVDGKPSFTLYHGTSGCRVQLYSGGSLDYLPYTPQTWQHICVTWNFDVNAMDLFVDGVKLAKIKPSSGDAKKNVLHDIYVGGTVASNGDVRNYRTSNTGVDEVAVYGFSANADEIAWLGWNRPGPIPRGRQMLQCFRFDAVDGDSVVVENAGTGRSRLSWKKPGVATPCQPGAAATELGLMLDSQTTFCVLGDAEEGLGCTTNSGFTLSFWIMPPETQVSWSDMLSLRIGGQNVRFEWHSAVRTFCWYGGCEFWNNTLPALAANEWSNVCLVWNHALGDCDVYVNGTNVGRLFLKALKNEIVDWLYVGTVCKEENGGDRWGAVPNAGIDEVALFNWSFAPDQVAWLCENAPALPELAETNLVRTVAGDGVWGAASAEWTVAGASRRTIWPATEDADVEAVVTVDGEAALSVDASVAARRVAFEKGAGAETAALSLSCADGVEFAPQRIAVGDGVTLAFAGGFSTTGVLELAANARIVVDAHGLEEGGAALTAGGFALPDGESDVLRYVSSADSRYVPSLSEDGRRILLSASDDLPVTATWTGAAGDGAWDNAANWDCRSAAGAALAGALPCEFTAVVVTDATGLNVPAGAVRAYRSFSVSGNASLTADCDWRGVECVRLLDGATLDVAGHSLRVGRFAGGALGTAAVTDSVGGGVLRVDVPEGETLANDSVSFTGRLKFVKDGGGTYVAAKDGQGNSGGMEVAAGTVRCALAGDESPLGPSGATVRIDAGAAFDACGTYGHHDLAFVLNGGTLRNGKSIYDAYRRKMLGAVRLEADSFMAMDESYGLSRQTSGATALDLGGRALDVKVEYGRTFYLHDADVSEGALNVTKGGYAEFGTNSVRAQAAALSIAAAIRAYAPVEVRDFVHPYPNPEYGVGQGVFSVGGTFTPSGKTHPNVRLLDGAAIDLSSKAGAWSARAVHAYTGTTNFLSVAENARATVNLAGRADLRELSKSSSPYVVTWDGTEIPASAAFDVDEETARARFFVRKDAVGLRLCYRSGTVFIVR